MRSDSHRVIDLPCRFVESRGVRVSVAVVSPPAANPCRVQSSPDGARESGTKIRLQSGREPAPARSRGIAPPARHRGVQQSPAQHRSRRLASRPTAIWPASTSPAARSTKLSCVSSIAVSSSPIAATSSKQEMTASASRAALPNPQSQPGRSTET